MATWPGTALVPREAMTKEETAEAVVEEMAEDMAEVMAEEETPTVVVEEAEVVEDLKPDPVTIVERLDISRKIAENG